MTPKNLIFACITCLFLTNCSSDDDLDNTDLKVTYTTDIRSIMNNNCTNCHGSPTSNGAPMPLTTFSEVKDAVENRDLIARINSLTNPMPQSGLIPKASRDLIQQWKDDGLLEN